MQSIARELVVLSHEARCPGPRSPWNTPPSTVVTDASSESLHWIRDVVPGEDDSRLTKAAQAMAALHQGNGPGAADELKSQRTPEAEYCDLAEHSGHRAYSVHR